MLRPKPAPAGAGQESVWDYPRPPRLEDTPRRIRVVFAGVTIADSVRAKRVLETSHPPTYYVLREDIRTDLLVTAGGTSLCEWKGAAAYYDIVIGDRSAPRATWCYPDPSPAFATIIDHFAFYAPLMDACFVDGEQITPQPGRFYGGWITSDLAGPFKGEPGSEGW